MAELTDRIRANLDQLRQRVKAGGRDPDEVTVVAVTKGFGRETVEAALEAGITDFGENYPADLLGKAESFREARVHFLGGIQRRQVASIAERIHLWQSVDRLEEGGAIAKVVDDPRVLIQVSLDPAGAEEGRSGVPLEQVGPLFADLSRKGLEVCGLMAVGPRPPIDPAPGFREVAHRARDLGLATVSLGMSGDVEAAVEAGSNMIRVGRGLFGDRPPRSR